MTLFPYIGHGTSFYQETFDALVWFQQSVTEAQLDAIAKLPLFASSIPFALDRAGESALLIRIGENHEYEIKARYDEAFRKEIEKSPEDTDVWGEDRKFLPSPEEWKRFDADFDAALTAAHRAHPVSFVIKASRPGKKYGPHSARHEESLASFHERCWPAIKDFLSGEQRDAMKPALVERFNLLVNGAVGTYLKKHKSKKDRSEVHLGMVDFLCVNHVRYHDEEYDVGLKWMEYEEHVFTLGGLLEKLLPKNKSAVPALRSLAPYTRLVCFAGSDYPYVLLFDDPAGCLAGLLGHIDPEKKDVLSDYLRLAAGKVYDWYRDGHEPMNRALVDAMSGLVLACDPVSTLAYRDVMDRWESFGDWDGILAHMKTKKYVGSYLIRYENPAEYLKEFKKKVPADQRAELPGLFAAIAAVVAATKPDENRYGWKHDMAAVSKAIAAMAAG